MTPKNPKPRFVLREVDMNAAVSLWLADYEYRDRVICVRVVKGESNADALKAALEEAAE
jgi:hypothetical protein